MDYMFPIQCFTAERNIPALLKPQSGTSAVVGMFASVIACQMKMPGSSVIISDFDECPASVTVPEESGTESDLTNEKRLFIIIAGPI